tara:strand:+ start:294 stop:575 length:282 start_codon:yes stop_codon:yes gene_type:complete
MAEIKIMFKNCGPEKTDERDKELEQVKEDMEELKKERIEAAKRKQSEKMKVLSRDKMAKMKDVKKNLLEQRPVGTGSCIGESFNNYSSPVKIG